VQDDRRAVLAVPLVCAGGERSERGCVGTVGDAGWRRALAAIAALPGGRSGAGDASLKQIEGGAVAWGS
jgi:hypothetical protein